MTRPGSPRLLLNTAGTHWWPPSGGRRRPPHENGTGGEEPDRAVLDPRGEHHQQSWTLALRNANPDVTTRGDFSGSVRIRPECQAMTRRGFRGPGESTRKGRPPDRGSRGLQRRTGLPGVHSQSVAPVVRPGVDGSKGTALAWVLGIFSRCSVLRGSGLRLTAMGGSCVRCTPRPRRGNSPPRQATGRNCPASWTSRTNRPSGPVRVRSAAPLAPRR
jgi:hypothetical protein